MTRLYKCVRPGCGTICDHAREVLCAGCTAATPPDIVKQVKTATIQFRQCYPCFRDRFEAAIKLLTTTTDRRCSV